MTSTNPYFPLPQPDAIGTLVGADDVRNAVKATILQWAPYYVAIVSQRLADAGIIGGTNRVSAPLDDFGLWDNDPQFRSLGTGMPACFLVTTPATVNNSIELQGNRQYRASWRAQVNLWVFGTTWEIADDLCSWYEKAVRLCILQHRSLGGFATSTNWKGNAYTDEIHTSTRTIGKCAMAFDVAVPIAIEVRGPQSVPGAPGPPPDDPTVLSTDVSIDKVPVDETLDGVNDAFEAEEDEVATFKKPVQPTAAKGSYSAITEAGYHYPDGFIAVGQSVALSKEEAERGLAAGLLAPTPITEEN